MASTKGETKKSLKEEIAEAREKIAQLSSDLAMERSMRQKLEKRLEEQEREKAYLSRKVRQLEAQIKKTNVKFYEDVLQIEQHRRSCKRANSRYRAVRRRTEKLKEEVSAANLKCRKVSRQLMRMARVAMAGDRRLECGASRDQRRSGNNNSIAEGDDHVALGTGNIDSIGDSDNPEAPSSSRSTPADSNKRRRGQAKTTASRHNFMP